MMLNPKIARMAFPLILANITIPLLGLCNAFCAGYLGTVEQAAAVALGTVIFDFLYWPFGFFRMGTVAMTANAYGRKDIKEQNVILSSALLSAVVLGIILVLLQKQILYLSFYLADGDNQTKLFASNYFKIRIYAAPAVFANSVLIGFFLGKNRTAFPFWISGTVNFIAISLGLLSTFVFNLGVVGIAISDAIGQYAGSIIGLFFLGSKYFASIFNQRLRWESKIFFKMLSNNFELFLRSCMIILVFVFFSTQSFSLGPVTLAANNILLQLILFVAYFQDGFVAVVETLTGQAMGNEKLNEIKKIIWHSGAWIFSIALLISLFFLVSGYALLNFMTDIESIIIESKKYIIFVQIMPLIGMWCFLFDGIYIGAGRFKAMRNTMILSFTGFFLIWLLTKNYHNLGLWIALTSFFAFRGIFMGGILWTQKGKFFKLTCIQK